PAGQAGEQPGASHIRKQPDADFRHGKACGFAHYAVTGTCHEADSPTHHNAVAPNDDRFGVVVNEVIQPVFHVEETPGVRVVPSVSGLVLKNGLVDAMQVTACTEGFFTTACKNHKRD